MKRMILFALILFGGAVFSVPGEARDKNGGWTPYGGPSCEAYLGAYGKATLTGKHTYNGPEDTVIAFSWIAGFVSAYNAQTANGRLNILAGKHLNATFRWLASWCRDNPSGIVAVGLLELFSKQ
jgi:hypothetical protein